ncbi:MAG TPA: hypothetical protein VMR18_02165 [Candidatus Saccharimonadales bacterium]|nr:hypothetical protein [Candidatus Saccharimonadales bacterium]
MDTANQSLPQFSQYLIVSVAKARRILGVEAKEMTDEEISSLIIGLDEVATEYIRGVPTSK